MTQLITSQFAFWTPTRHDVIDLIAATPNAFNGALLREPTTTNISPSSGFFCSRMSAASAVALFATSCAATFPSRLRIHSS
jgi:hypothetical protein